MRLTYSVQLICSTLLIILLSGCASSSGVRVTEGSAPIGAVPAGTVITTTAAVVVHVDENERLATLRMARQFPKGAFLGTHDDAGNRSAVLKARPNRTVGLRIADILEGLPEINDEAKLIGGAEHERLAELYPSAESDSVF